MGFISLQKNSENLRQNVIHLNHRYKWKETQISKIKIKEKPQRSSSCFANTHHDAATPHLTFPALICGCFDEKVKPYPAIDQLYIAENTGWGLKIVIVYFMGHILLIRLKNDQIAGKMLFLGVSVWVFLEEISI